MWILTEVRICQCTSLLLLHNKLPKIWSLKQHTFIISELLCPHTADLDPLHRVSKAAFKMLTKATFSSRDLTGEESSYKQWRGTLDSCCIPSAIRGHLQFLVMWSFSQAVHNMATNIFKASRRMGGILLARHSLIKCNVIMRVTSNLP